MSKRTLLALLASPVLLAGCATDPLSPSRPLPPEQPGFDGGTIGSGGFAGPTMGSGGITDGSTEGSSSTSVTSPDSTRVGVAGPTIGSGG